MGRSAPGLGEVRPLAAQRAALFVLSTLVYDDRKSWFGYIGALEGAFSESAPSRVKVHIRL